MADRRFGTMATVWALAASAASRAGSGQARPGRYTAQHGAGNTGLILVGGPTGAVSVGFLRSGVLQDGRAGCRLGVRAASEIGGLVTWVPVLGTGSAAPGQEAPGSS
jgi:hypothetical protein